MEDTIFGIIEQLTKHDISKTEAVSKLLFLYNAVESKPSTKAALNASVSAIKTNKSQIELSNFLKNNPQFKGKFVEISKQKFISYKQLIQALTESDIIDLTPI